MAPWVVLVASDEIGVRQYFNLLTSQWGQDVGEVMRLLIWLEGGLIKNLLTYLLPDLL
jgi:hypothetical protein